LISTDSVSKPEAGNFPVSISEIGFGIINSQPIFGANIALNFGEENEPSTFSASTKVKIYTLIETNPETNKQQWKYDKFTLSTITLAVNTEPFTLNGLINFMNDDPVYGKGFYGGLSLQIKSVMESPMSMACAFGRVNGYRYWMVDATIPTSIILGSATITSVTGGISYHMQNTKTPQQLIQDVSDTTSEPNLSQNYIPNQTSGLYFKAGVGFKNTFKEETLNGDVLFTIAFNSNGGLQNIALLGDAYMDV